MPQAPWIVNPGMPHEISKAQGDANVASYKKRYDDNASFRQKEDDRAFDEQLRRSEELQSWNR